MTPQKADQRLLSRRLALGFLFTDTPKAQQAPDSTNAQGDA
jgi:hypothetical protein